MIEVKSGDYGYNINFSITEADGTAKVLDGYTITLKVWGSTLEVFIGECEQDSTTGACHYEVKEGDFELPLGIPFLLYDAEIELTKTGEKLSTETFQIRLYSSP